MKKNSCLLLLLISACHLNNTQANINVSENKFQQSNATNNMDTLIMLSGKKMVVSLYKINNDNVSYKMTGEKNPILVDKKDIQEIILGTGKIIEVNKTVAKEEPVKKEERLDTIVKLGGKKLLVKVIKINEKDVTYTFPEKTDNLSILRKDIEKVIFQNGHREVFNPPVLMMIDETQWEAVLVTENPEEVEGLFLRGTISASSSSDCRDNKSAKQSAIIRLQKKAANMKASVILITKAQAKGGYGENPGYKINGNAYGLEPLPKTDAEKKSAK